MPEWSGAVAEITTAECTGSGYNGGRTLYNRWWERMVHMNRLRAFFEGIVVLAILLVVAQTFLEDLAVLAGWSWDLRLALLFAGFGLDVFFSIEFLTRLYFSFVNRRALTYFRYERGWVDLVASLPLVIVSSGPIVLAYLTGAATLVSVAGMLNVLKVVKAIRIARVLRLLRLLKLFSRVRHADSVMAERHVAKIATVAVSLVLFGLLGMNVLMDALDVPGAEARYQEQSLSALNRLAAVDRTSPAGVDELRGRAALEADVLAVQDRGRVLYSRLDDEAHELYFGPSDYGFGERDGLRVFFDLRPLHQQQSRISLTYFALIVLLVFGYLLGYAPHFAMTVSDPIHVMCRGLNESHYDLEVRIPDVYGSDEVYRLGRLYNEVYLPMKERARGTGDEALDVKLEQMRDHADE